MKPASPQFQLQTESQNGFVRKVSRGLFDCALIAAAFVFIAPASFAQSNDASSEKSFYDQVRSFSLGGGSATVSGLVLNRDRAQMTFNGTFYFASLVDGHV